MISPRATAMLRFAIAAVSLLLFAGCISVDPKSQATPLSAAQPGARFHAPVSVKVILTKDDEDLRGELEAEVSNALKAAGVSESRSAASHVELRVDHLRRVSKASRVWNGQLAGRVEYRLTLQFSNGERVQLQGDLGAKYGYHQAWGATTSDGIKRIAEILAMETANRLKQTNQ